MYIHQWYEWVEIPIVMGAVLTAIEITPILSRYENKVFGLSVLLGREAWRAS